MSYDVTCNSISDRKLSQLELLDHWASDTQATEDGLAYLWNLDDKDGMCASHLPVITVSFSILHVNINLTTSDK